MKKIMDKTVGLKQISMEGNTAFFKAGNATLMPRGTKFVLLPGRQVVETIVDSKTGKTINVFRFRTLQVGADGKSMNIVSSVKLSDLVFRSYGPVSKDEAGNRLPAPKVGFTTSSRGKWIPETFGEETNCGWTRRIVQAGTTMTGEKLYDIVVDEPQLFEVEEIQLHWFSVFDADKWCTAEDEDGNVLMRAKPICILKRLDKVPEELAKQAKELAKTYEAK